jgi:hypothetical protein
MPKFYFDYEEIYTFRGWFDADTQEQADQILQTVEDQALDFGYLPNFHAKDKGYFLEIGNAQPWIETDHQRGENA